LSGKTVIGEDCVIGPQSRLEDVTVADGSTVMNSVAVKSVIGKNCQSGRSASAPDRFCMTALFSDLVEIKNS
jgi:bifunctional UDP-N-acetylglucosamine pyrophosphorylase/glucosamine-1-phosphate N-acetyltransferase